MKKLINSIAPLSASERERYPDECLAWLLQVAARLQRCEQVQVAQVFGDYCRHFETAFEDGVDTDEELVKVAMLLAAMFDNSPIDKTDKPKRDPTSFGWSFAPLDGNPCDPFSWTAPFIWTTKGPILCARRGHSASRYLAREEFLYRSEQFRPRKGLVEAAELVGQRKKQKMKAASGDDPD